MEITLKHNNWKSDTKSSFEASINGTAITLNPFKRPPLTTRRLLILIHGASADRLALEPSGVVCYFYDTFCTKRGWTQKNSLWLAQPGLYVYRRAQIWHSRYIWRVCERDCHRVDIFVLLRKMHVGGWVLCACLRGCVLQTGRRNIYISNKVVWRKQRADANRTTLQHSCECKAAARLSQSPRAMGKVVSIRCYRKPNTSWWCFDRSNFADTHTKNIRGKNMQIFTISYCVILIYLL